MAKPRLTRIVEEFFESVGNHDLTKYMEIRHKLLEFIKDEDLFLTTDDENFILATDIIRSIDANSIYAKTTNNKKAYHHIEPFLKRIIELDSNEWDYDELKLVINSINFTDSMRQAIELAHKASERIIGFQIVRLTDNVEGALACSMCSRILNAKYFDNDVEIDLAKEFDNWLDKLEYLTEANKESEYLEMIWHITKIRKQIFHKNDAHIFTLCDGLLPRYDKQIGQMIGNEVKFYHAAGAFD